MSLITSLQHPKVKQARALHDADARREAGAFLAEGVRLLEEAFASGLRCDGFFYTDALLERPQGRQLLERARRAKAPLLELSEKVFSSLKETKTSQGAVGLFRRPSWAEPWEAPLRAGLVVVACEIRDPGNLGTILRISETAGARGLLAAKGTVDPYHPKVVRASMGSLFRLPVVLMDDISAMLSGPTQVVATVAHEGRAPWEVDLTRPTFLLVGQEAAGLPDSLLAKATARVTIPMAKPVESLNVATATAMLLYEFIRQQKNGVREQFR
ncbi:MAG: RNA methyltransferase [Nitrospirota bacterium]